MTYFFWIWLAVAVLSLIFEFVTMEMVSIWFVPSGIVALILNACSVNLAIQIIVFFVISIVLILSLRRIALRFISKNDNTKTNAKAEVGKRYKLITPTDDDGIGTIKINGVIWNVKSQDGAQIEQGEYVELVELDGNKYIVKSINKN